MSDPSGSTPENLPTVDEGVLDAMHTTSSFDPDDGDQLLESLVDADQNFASWIVTQAHKRSNGDFSRQASFIEGATFATEALKRTFALLRINPWGTIPDDLAGEDLQ